MNNAQKHKALEMKSTQRRISEEGLTAVIMLEILWTFASAMSTLMAVSGMRRRLINPILKRLSTDILHYTFLPDLIHEKYRI